MNNNLSLAQKLASAGMKSQGTRLRVIAQNLANADSTAKTAGGDPYRRQVVTFKNVLDRDIGARVSSVDKIGPDGSEFIQRYMPGHPAADPAGFVKFPNVNPVIEMMDMREAQRSYEAGLSVFKAARLLKNDTVDLLRS